MASQLVRSRFTLTVLLSLVLCAIPLSGVATAHPMGNFSISHYSGLTVHPNRVEIRYLLDMAEIPTFQEIQSSGIVAEAGHPSLDGYLGEKSEALKDGLVLQINSERVPLRTSSKTVLFSAGAGGLPTMKLGLVFRAPLPDTLAPRLNRLSYEDSNFPDRAGWKEIIADSGPGVALAVSSVPERDRSRQLSDYATDLMNSPPQVVQAALTFALDTPAGPVTASVRPTALLERGPDKPPRPTTRPAVKADAEQSPPTSLETPAPPPTQTATLELQTNRQASRRDRFTDLIASGATGPGIVFFAALVAATLGAFHALEPGHGKTVVAAYLVGSRGRARHAMLLGLIVTISHTAGVYLLGAVTLYASRYIVPERLYPWLGALSGLTIAVLGFCLFLKRYARSHEHGHSHDASDHDHAHPHHHDDGHHHHDHEHHHRGHHHHGHHHHHVPSGTTVSLKEMLALGVTGGIVPCPAALVVLLSAVALRRIAFGLFLIVAFSVGLAAVLIAIGLLMVYARRLMTRVEGTGPLVTRWLPLTSSVTITVLGVAIAAQALINAGILTIRLG
jgi:ABC-type nickel/cobalt efflux system permease component RcnA